MFPNQPNMSFNMMQQGMMMYQPQPAQIARGQENCLYIGNIHPDLSEDVLFGEFVRFGTITGCKIMWNTYTRESRCFGFVTFQTKADAERAQAAMNGADFYKRELRVYLKKNLRSLNPDANFIIKDVDKSVTTRQLTEECRKFGEVISCFVRREEVNGRLESLGYGYVQFADGADCAGFLEAFNGREINGKKVKVERFVSAKLRERPQSKNLYVKQFPAAWNQEQIEKFVNEQFTRFGKINLCGVYKDARLGKFYAFVALDEAEQATEAIAKMNGQLLEGGEALYVGQAQSKGSRRAMLRSERTNVQNQTNMYIRSLKQGVTKEQLQAAVSKYGTITSICVKEWSQPVRPKIEGQDSTLPEMKPLQFGFFNFDTQEAALACFNGYKQDPDIRALADVESDTVNFVFFAQTKQVREQYLRVTKRNHVALGMRMGGLAPGLNMRNMPQKPFARGMQPQGPIGGPRGKQVQMPFGMGHFVQGMPAFGVPAPFGNNMMPMGGNMPGVSPLGAPFGQPQPPKSTPTPGEPKEMPRPNNSPFSVNIAAKDNREIAAELKRNRSFFLSMRPDEQKNFLGNIMYLRVKKFNSDENLLPKITGMLIDLEVLDYDEIVEIIENDMALKDRIDEAIDVITENNQAS